MDRNGNHHHRLAEQENGHLSEDDLLLYADGELSREQAVSSEAHLEACWSCRARVEKYEETIRSFVEYRETIHKPMSEAPPNGWRRFDRVLGELVVEKGHQSPVTRLRGWLGALRPALPNLSFNPQFAGRLAAVVVIAAIVIGLLLIRSNSVTTVSASELLERAAEAQSESLLATAQPVLHQKLQLRVRNHAAAREDSARWEVWNDVQGARFRSFVAGQTSNADVVGNLTRVLEANRLDPQQPLSASAYQSWRNTLGQKQEDVTKTKLAGGDEALTLHTKTVEAVNEGRIAEATITVRASDWLPVEQSLTIKSGSGSVLYEIAETSSEVLSLNQVSPAIFEGATPVIAATDNKLTAKSSPNANVAPAGSSTEAVAVATTELEVEVLRLLNQAGADLNEQIEVTRMPEGRLQVKGIVDTEARKREILNTLATVSSNPAVRIQIETIAEAVRRESAQPKSGPATINRVEINKGSMPAEAELRRYFSAGNGDVDEQIRQFASRAINHSQQALFHASALKRLGERFSPEQLSALDSNARAKWMAIIRQHARALQQETAALRQQLEPVFGTAAGGQGQVAIKNDADLISTIARLVGLASANDRIVRSAFTISTSGSTGSAIKTPQFAQSLNAAEGLAASIANSGH